MTNSKTITISVISSTLLSLLVAGLVYRFVLRPDTRDLMATYYATENAVSYSPHSLRKKMDSGDTNFILVDLRSAEEYEKEHIAGAINIPAYKDKDHSAYDQIDRIVVAFAALPKDKDIITYCYSIPCMTSRKVGDMLAKHDIYTKHLNIGWNEWRYFWNLWNHEHEWTATDVNDYIATGKEPGSPKLRPENIKGCTQGELGC